MDFDSLPSKPVIKSLTSAQADWDEWLLRNNFDVIRDQDGLEWRMSLTFEQFPSDHNRHAGKWVANIQLGVDCNINKLVETGTLDPVDDHRLISLAGSGQIPLRMKRLQYEAQSENEMRQTMSRVLPELRENFGKSSLHTVKRDLLGRWLDFISRFGQREELHITWADARNSSDET